MTLEDAEKIQASLTELSPDIEDFYWVLLMSLQCKEEKKV